MAKNPLNYLEIAAAYNMTTDNREDSTLLLVDVAEACEIRENAIVMELGVREGGGLLALMVGSVNSNSRNVHVALDPYGDLPYKLGESTDNWTYPNSMKNATIPKLFRFTNDHNVSFQFFNLDDAEFFSRFGDGVPVYEHGTKHLMNTYAIVHLDGPHDTLSLTTQIEFLAPRMITGSFIIVDDTDRSDWMDMAVLRALLSDRGFILWKETTNRQAFIKQ